MSKKWNGLANGIKQWMKREWTKKSMTEWIMKSMIELANDWMKDGCWNETEFNKLNSDWMRIDKSKKEWNGGSQIK